MSIKMKELKTPLEMADALTNLLGQMFIAHLASDDETFEDLHEAATILSLELTQALEKKQNDSLVPQPVRRT